MNQNVTSANTSIKLGKGRMSAIYGKLGNVLRGKHVIDVGGGKYDDNIVLGKERYDCDIAVYDPYNRTEEHNREVLSGKYDFVVCSNVANVIDSDEARYELYELCKSLCKITYLTVYERNGNGIGEYVSDDSYQANRKLKDYIPELNEVFSLVTMKNQMLICTR